MKRRAITLILSALIGLTMLVIPIYADNSYSFTYVKRTGWTCNGVQYQVKWKNNYFRVYKYDPQTSKAVSNVPIGPKIGKNDDSFVYVEETKADTGLVYITVEKYYREWLYCYDQKTGKAFLAKKGANVLAKSGDYFIGTGRMPTDVTPIKLTLYRFTPDGCSKVKTIADRSADVIASGGYFYYMQYPNMDCEVDGYVMPDMHQIKIYRINPDGSGRTLLKTLTAKHLSDAYTDYKFTAHKAILWLNQKKITVRY